MSKNEDFEEVERGPFGDLEEVVERFEEGDEIVSYHLRLVEERGFLRGVGGINIGQQQVAIFCDFCCFWRPTFSDLASCGQVSRLKEGMGWSDQGGEVEGSGQGDPGRGSREGLK